MERLQSQQDKLSQWLSADSGHILDECGDILSVNELKKITGQPKEEQMSLLLKLIISKGADACEAFTDILRRNQGQYHQLQQFFRSSSDDSAVTSIFADENSVVTSRTLRNVNTKSLTCKVETVSSPRGNPSGHSASGAHYTAAGGSVIIADRIDGVKAGNINFSVNINPSQVPPAPAGTADDLCQQPAGRTIKEKKVKLIECLMADADFVLQQVDQKSIISHREYQNLRFSSGPQETVIRLLDLVLSKGPGKCDDFLQLLTDPEVLETFPPLRDILDITDQN
ncbi:uncharacterized protein LOC106955145 isoform X1 [Poecilia latipinna]|uniref:uncharacterized protein LOC106955145 isoform X1 n=1 Tax=Poecilia latipinna TaxID=48699 RepID=UPI00072DD274|nr:PREDICTED: uncharacterized protein LOC106955145 isoform X1 [Poecilia latipinna]